MAEFSFDLDQKITKWVRTKITIQADSIEEAKQLVIKMHLDLETTELSYDEIECTEEFIFPNENDGQFTEELMIASTGESFWRNTDYSIYLDDKRTPPNNNYLLVTSYDDFVKCIEKNGLPKYISFDHDLGFETESEEKTGYNCALWLVNYCMDNKLTLPKYDVHSQNPVGKDNINALFKNFLRTNS